MNDVLFGGGIDGFVDAGEELDAFVLLAFLQKIRELAGHSLQLRLKRLAARAADNVLAGGFDGGLGDGHGLGKGRIPLRDQNVVNCNQLNVVLLLSCYRRFAGQVARKG